MGHPLAFAAYLQHIGAPADRYFERSELPSSSWNPDDFVPLKQAWALFDLAAHDVDPAIGWRVGRFVGDNQLNRAFLRKLDDAPTLYEALKRFVRLSSAEASHLHLGIQERRDDVVLFTHYPDMKGVPGYHPSQSYQLGVILGVIRHFTGKNWLPEEIGIEYPIVPGAAEEQFPNSRILPRQRTGYVTIARSFLNLAPNRCSSEDRETSSLLLSESFDFRDSLRALLRPRLAEGYPDAMLAASLMDTSVRTLARRLEEAGLTYRAVVDELRFNEAKRLLSHTDAPVIDVAAAVGFAEPTNFARMFRRIGGLSPRDFRRTLKS